MKEKAHQEAKEKGYEEIDQKTYALINKIIKDLESLLDLYEH